MCEWMSVCRRNKGYCLLLSHCVRQKIYHSVILIFHVRQMGWCTTALNLIKNSFMHNSRAHSHSHPELSGNANHNVTNHSRTALKTESFIYLWHVYLYISSLFVFAIHWLGMRSEFLTKSLNSFFLSVCLSIPRNCERFPRAISTARDDNQSTTHDIFVFWIFKSGLLRLICAIDAHVIRPNPLTDWMNRYSHTECEAKTRIEIKFADFFFVCVSREERLAIRVAVPLTAHKRTNVMRILFFSFVVEVHTQFARAREKQKQIWNNINWIDPKIYTQNPFNSDRFRHERKFSLLSFL